jgi:hypothetical protein
MTDRPPSHKALTALLTPDAEEFAASMPGRTMPKSHPLPTLDQRVDIFLRAVAESVITPELRASARDRIMDAMAVDLASECSSQDVTPAGQLRSAASPVAAQAPVHGYVQQWRPSLIAGAASDAARRVLKNWLIRRKTLAEQLLLPLRGSRMVPLLAVLVLVIVGSAIWLYLPTETYRVASTKPESNLGASETFVVQILGRSSESDAQAAYLALQTKFPNILRDRAPLIRRVELGDASIVYRAELGPYNSFEQAREICGKLLDANDTCLVRRQ